MHKKEAAQKQVASKFGRVADLGMPINIPVLVNRTSPIVPKWSNLMRLPAMGESKAPHDRRTLLPQHKLGDRPYAGIGPVGRAPRPLILTADHHAAKLILQSRERADMLHPPALIQRRDRLRPRGFFCLMKKAARPGAPTRFSHASA